MTSPKKRSRRPKGSGIANAARGDVHLGALRVISGTAGGLRLDAPKGETTRPTADRVREALFNALDSLDAIDDARVLDAFAGSGALGIEALSRGASVTTFVDVDPVARTVVAANLERTSLAARGVVVGGDAMRLLVAGPWDLILLDPPYAREDLDALVAAAAEGLAPAGVVVVESDREVSAPKGLDVIRMRRYGSTVVTFLSRPGASL